MNLEIDPVQGTVTGHIEIDCQAAPDAKELYLGLDLNGGEKPNPKQTPLVQSKGPQGFTPSGADVSALTVNGQASPLEYLPLNKRGTNAYATERQALRLPLGAASDQTVTVAFIYRADMATMDDTHTVDFFISRFTWLPSLITDKATVDGSLLR
jgi:hypothetical protein